MEIILKNAAIEERTCLLSGKAFKNESNVLFTDGLDRPISWNEAVSRQWKFSNDFQIPGEIKSREALGKWLSGIGIKRNSAAFLDAYKKWGKNLDPVEVMNFYNK